MALSYSSVQKAYEVLNKIKNEFPEIELNILSWPSDMGDWEDSKKKNPPLAILHGWGKKSDDGWESISFFLQVGKIPEGLTNRFKELAKEHRVPNTYICEPYHMNEKLFCIGWY
ncbi:MAG: hypothetical protein V4581_16720 [Bacteroidota bacterium]